jgi:hypothetical protein
MTNGDDASSDVGAGSIFTTADVDLMTCPDAEVDGPGDERRAETGDAKCIATRAVTFSQDVLPITRKCAGEICHLWAPPSMVGVRADQCCDGRPIVSAGDPGGSYLLDKLSGSNICRGVRMPYGGTPLSPAKMQTIADWICADALND